MSDEHRAKLAAIKAAMRDKAMRMIQFTEQWERLAGGLLYAKLDAIAKDQDFAYQCPKVAKENGTLYLEMRQSLTGPAYRLTYQAAPADLCVSVSMHLPRGRRDVESFTLDVLTESLIESQVETFVSGVADI